MMRIRKYAFIMCLFIGALGLLGVWLCAGKMWPPAEQDSGFYDPQKQLTWVLQKYVQPATAILHETTCAEHTEASLQALLALSGECRKADAVSMYDACSPAHRRKATELQTAELRAAEVALFHEVARLSQADFYGNEKLRIFVYSHLAHPSSRAKQYIPQFLPYSRQLLEADRTTDSARAEDLADEIPHVALEPIRNPQKFPPEFPLETHMRTLQQEIIIPFRKLLANVQQAADAEQVLPRVYELCRTLRKLNTHPHFHMRQVLSLPAEFKNPHYDSVRGEIALLLAEIKRLRQHDFYNNACLKNALYGYLAKPSRHNSERLMPLFLPYSILLCTADSAADSDIACYLAYVSGHEDMQLIYDAFRRRVPVIRTPDFEAKVLAYLCNDSPYANLHPSRFNLNQEYLDIAMLDPANKLVELYHFSHGTGAVQPHDCGADFCCPCGIRHFFGCLPAVADKRLNHSLESVPAYVVASWSHDDAAEHARRVFPEQLTDVQKRAVSTHHDSIILRLAPPCTSAYLILYYDDASKNVGYHYADADFSLKK